MCGDESTWDRGGRAVSVAVLIRGAPPSAGRPPRVAIRCAPLVQQQLSAIVLSGGGLRPRCAVHRRGHSAWWCGMSTKPTASGGPVPSRPLSETCTQVVDAGGPFVVSERRARPTTSAGSRPDSDAWRTPQIEGELRQQGGGVVPVSSADRRRAARPACGDTWRSAVTGTSATPIRLLTLYAHEPSQRHGDPSPSASLFLPRRR